MSGRIVIDPTVVRLFRDGIEAHRREVAQLGHCRTCGDPAPEQDEAPDDDRGLEASTTAQVGKASTRGTS